MSDSSEEEDLSRFKDAVDTSFVRLINESRSNNVKESDSAGSKKSERYLEISSHYNDVKVPDEMQKKIGAKISEIITRNVEFVTLDNKIKNRKIKGGVKLFKNSDDYLSHEQPKDTLTEIHNFNSKNFKNQRRKIDSDTVIGDEDKIKQVAVTGEFVMSKAETKCWKSRRKEKVFNYKTNGTSKVLISED